MTITAPTPKRTRPFACSLQPCLARLGTGLAFLLCAMSTAWAAEPIVSFDTNEQRDFYEHLLEEYRCLKCQNQNLADSNAGLAADLREDIREQVLAGKGKNEIDNYLVDRYGEFVLYRPRFNTRTLLLWLGPFALLLLVLLTLLFRYRRRSSAPADTVSEAGDSALAAGQAATADSVDSARLSRARELLKDRGE